MKIKDLLEDASVSSSSAGDIASVPDAHVTNPYLKHNKGRQPKPKKVKPTDNALDMNVSLFGGPALKR